MIDSWFSNTLGKIFKRAGKTVNEAKKEFRSGYRDSLMDGDWSNVGDSEELEPFIDVFKKEDEVMIVAELPEAVEERIKLRLSEEEVLHIRAPTKKNEEYSANIRLPSRVKEKRVRKQYKNGVLTLWLNVYN